ncbi:hypothetical protein B0T25DRAFT_567157 [Lasiosphaeria hispida]|uniref:Uncharacterized protein n=1 Tax=Lasiosphaeria hispida TaxID=260671 RepID=A0AAJ0HNL2_9PEZI|nr:hypothetical protein B0T25DRAFT_567157 [Lasiosphaeria hispida]
MIPPTNMHLSTAPIHRSSSRCSPASRRTADPKQMQINLYTGRHCSAYTGEVAVAWANKMGSNGKNCFNYNRAIWGQHGDNNCGGALFARGEY